MRRISRIFCFAVSASVFVLQAESLLPTVNLTGFAATRSEIYVDSVSASATDAIDSALVSKIHEITYHWTAKILQLYVQRLVSEPPSRRLENGTGYILLRYKVDTKGKILEVESETCTVKTADLCSVVPKYFRRQKYRGLKIDYEVNVSCALVFNPDDASIQDPSTLPTFQEHWKRFREKYEGNRY